MLPRFSFPLVSKVSSNLIYRFGSIQAIDVSETIVNMTAASIAPLRKKDAHGKLYTRLPDIEAKLVEISSLTRDKISARCAIQDPESADYLPSECLLYLVREHRSRPFDECSETLFKALLERVLHGLPQVEGWDGSERLTDCNVRDEGRYRFLAMLQKDRQEYVERLDFYEVRFAKALSVLRVDAQRKVYRIDNPLESIEIDHETGEIAQKVERAAGSFDPFDSAAIGDFDLYEAIDALPDLEKAIVEMIGKGIPIESKEPEIVNIANTLGKTAKTIRTHRDKAYATLRAALTKGEPR